MRAFVGIYVLAALAGAAPFAHAQGLKTVYTFAGQNVDGAQPAGGLVAVGRVLYGVTFVGGSGASGTIFQFDTGGAGYKSLYSFQGGLMDGGGPGAGLIAVGTMLYGTTAFGGAYDEGTIFSFDTASPDLPPVILYSFAGVSAGGTDGSRPAARLVYAGGLLYGTTSTGGSTDCFDQQGCGTVFSYDTSQPPGNPGNVDAVIHSFAGLSGDGSNPVSGLTLSGSVLYGTTSSGGGTGCFAALGCGTIFSVGLPASSQTYGVAYAFQGGAFDGADPVAELTDGGSGVFYGNTRQGGGNGCGGPGCGTAFSFTPAPPGGGSSVSLLSCFGGPSGVGPNGAFSIVKGVAYGTTFGGGNASGRSGGSGTACSGVGPAPSGVRVAGGGNARQALGTVYGLTIATGQESVLFNFTQPLNAGVCTAATPCAGYRPSGQLVQAGNALYGESSTGGYGDSGTLFRLRLSP